MEKDSVWFLGGLSGGHMYPLFSILKKEQFQNSVERYHFFIPKNELIENIIANQLNLQSDISIIRYPKPIKSWRLILFLVYSVIIFFKIFFICFFRAPLKIYSTGGYFSIPFACCAWIFSIPFYMYHLDIVPGLAGRLISKYCNTIECVLYEETKKYLSHKNNIVLVDYPIRYSILDKKYKDEVKGLLNKLNYYIIFILGGSQGSEEINDYIISIIPILRDKKIYIIHQTGKKQKDTIIDIYKKNRIEAVVFDYNNHLLNYYNASDLIIGRAGAGTLAEIDFFKKDALIIPLQGVASNHQVKNAEFYSKKNNLIQVIFNKESFLIKINQYIF
jgi:UDP-N-acetylglucosamine--N-acetylmuramyl-(pentapeptide) pyrophosphoryl-undecaprenol N-acetylglucosamine transferase